MPARFTHVADACAVIAYLKGEAGHDRFAEILQDERNVAAIHAVNLCEVYYNYLRSDGVEVAEQALESTAKVLAIVEKADQGFLKRVARWKVEHKLGLADAFAAATAEEYASRLVTCDHNDFGAIEETGELQIEWIR